MVDTLLEGLIGVGIIALLALVVLGIIALAKLINRIK